MDVVHSLGIYVILGGGRWKVEGIQLFCSLNLLSAHGMYGFIKWDIPEIFHIPTILGEMYLRFLK